MVKILYLCTSNEDYTVWKRILKDYNKALSGELGGASSQTEAALEDVSIQISIPK